MSWSDCRKDSQGRNIGYVWNGICDKEGCKTEIHRGLFHACGDMHGVNGYDCEKYFCGSHLQYFYVENEERYHQLCESCGKEHEDMATREDRTHVENSEENQ